MTKDPGSEFSGYFHLQPLPQSNLLGLPLLLPHLLPQRLALKAEEPAEKQSQAQYSK